MGDPLLDRLTEVFLRAVGDSAKAESTLRMRSRTLQSALVVSTSLSPLRIRLHLPHYWAIYHHEGRDAITFPPGKYMVFFPDIKDDPRVDGGASYPVTRADRRHLTREQFRYFSAINRHRKAAGQDPIMVVTSRVGPAAARPFFREGVRDVFDSGLASDLASALITHYLESSLNPLHGRGNVVVNL